jgi:hypothetical protein
MAEMTSLAVLSRIAQLEVSCKDVTSNALLLSAGKAVRISTGIIVVGHI